ncbi:hypothetical protein SAY87_023888 [Trapa incisa]|uniref:Uncharacterized protein n=1 Tax=Trapa incisa TaxID=236973 RepID=A0AAN7L7K3_9MYRT|nr:hypothetical protein SAY87_023888 [Trapa incisa]
MQICIAAGGFLEAPPLPHFGSVKISMIKPEGQSWREIGTESFILLVLLAGLAHFGIHSYAVLPVTEHSECRVLS